jgi:hypothetical protein
MTFEHFVLAWPIVGTSLVAAVVLLVVWLQDRRERHKAR